MKRILPKLIGFALVAGIASLVLAMIAKLLMGLVFIGLVAFYIKSVFKNRRAHMRHSFGDPRFTKGYFQDQQSPFNDARATAFSNPRQSVGIVPIN